MSTPSGQDSVQGVLELIQQYGQAISLEDFDQATRDYDAIAAALASSVSKPEAQEPEPAVCPECDGSGEIMVMSDGGPDAYEVPVCCDHCNGNQTLDAAYGGVLKLLEAERKKYHEAAAILFLGRADRKAADRMKEIAEYIDKGWARDRLLALADMASVAATPPTGSSEGAKP